MSALQAIERGLESIGYRPETLHRDYRYADVLSRDAGERTVALAAFTQVPESYRSAAFGVVNEQDGDPAEAIAVRRSLGAPLFLSIGAECVNVWRVGASGAPERIDSVGLDALAEWFTDHAERWNPQALHRAKSSAPNLPRQLDFVDLGLLPAIEHEVQTKLNAILDEVLQILLGKSPTPAREDAAFRATFRLLAAKILSDREHPDALLWTAGDVGAVLQGIGAYYGLDSTHTPWRQLREQTLQTAWEHLRRSINLRNISADSLAFVYENTLVTIDSRKRFGTHGTPRHIADYALSRLDLGRFDLETLRIHEPFAGAGAFLLSAVRHLQDLLPADWTPERRHEFLTPRISGAEIDAFACEVAVLSLILADYPAKNGWKMKNSDLFAEGALKRELQGATVILCNPPFEDFTKAERERYPETVRISYSKVQYALKAALDAEPEALAFVMPHGLRRRRKFASLRKALSLKYRTIELLSLPEGTFTHAQFETVLVLASEARVAESSESTRVRAGTLPRRDRNGATDALVPPDLRIGARPAGSDDLWIGRLDSVWDALEASARLGDLIVVHRGLEWWDQQQGASEVSRESYRPGVFLPGKSLRPFRLTATCWLNFSPDSLRYPGPATWPWADPKVLVNAKRSSRGNWRLSAAADASGLAASQQFLAIWPRDDSVSAELLAAILNSPLVNAYLCERASGQDLTNEMLKAVPMPSHLDRHAMLEAVVEYKAGLDDGYTGVLVDEAELETKLRRIDELVLDGYGLAEDLRALLFDYFAGQRRPVDHRFTGWDPIPQADPVRAAREHALARGRRQMAADLQEGGDALTASETAQLLGVSLDEVRRLAGAGDLLALTTEGELVFPCVQFRDGKVLPGLIEVLAYFPDPSPWARLNYLVNSDLRLEGKRPIDCLIAGDIDRVIFAARQVGEQSAA